MATRSSVLAWRMPWTQEPGRLRSMGSRESDTTERLNHQHHLLTKSSREGGQASLSCCLPWCSPCLSVSLSCLLKRGLVPSWGLCPPALRTSHRPQLQTPSLGALAHRCGGGWKHGLGLLDDSAIRTLPAAQEMQETRGVGQKVQKLISGSGRSPGGGGGNPLQCPCLENPMDREAWWAAVRGVAEGQTRLKQPAR